MFTFNSGPITFVTCLCKNCKINFVHILKERFGKPITCLRFRRIIEQNNHRCMANTYLAYTYIQNKQWVVMYLLH